MPITKENMQKFYRGAAAENIVASKALLHGFEAHKYNPDLGVDLLITNKARQKFFMMIMSSIISKLSLQ